MEFNINPYYDDFKENALDNNYVRILFKPEQAVQARELTQIQSILQNQIRQFGDHIFQDGSPVIGGNLTLDNKIKFLKLDDTFNNQDIEIAEFDRKIIRNDEATVQAKVVATYFPTDGVPTLMVKYITGNEFENSSNVTVAGTTTKARTVSANSSGFGTVCSINEGVFYVDGFFVKVSDQSTVVSPYSTSANVKIGLEISDDIVDSVVDSSLLDPALGSFNYQAPGADRYQFNLTLSTRPLDTTIDESRFFELMRVENGAITKQVKYPIYAELEKTLARRTFDESGDYIVRPFRATISDDVDANNYVISIEPGKAYVKGFEFETIGTNKIVTAKPRSAADVKSYVDVDVDTSYGNYLYVTSMRGSSNGFINIAGLEKVDIHCVDSSNVAVGLGTTANAWIYANTKIGTARIRNFVRYSADSNTIYDSNGVYKLYLSDLDVQPKVLKITSATAGTIILPQGASGKDNAYKNVTVTILPVKLDAVANVNRANVFINSYRLNANSAVANVFNGNVTVGSIIRVGDMVRQVISVNTSGDYLTVNSAWTQTIEATSAANPLEVYVQTTYSQNVVNQTRTVASYVGSTRTLTLDRNFDNDGVPDVNTVIQLNYGIDDAEAVLSGAVVSNTLATAANASMNVALDSKLINGDVVVEEFSRNKLIFNLPAQYVRRSSLNNVDYNYNKIILNRSNTGTAGQFAISQGSGLESFETIPWADSTGSIQDNLIVVVRNNNGNVSYPNGSILQLTSANVVIGSPATSLTIDTNVPDVLTVDLIVNVKQNDAEDKIRTKNFFSNTTASISPFNYPTSNTLANTEVSLTNLGHVASIDVANGFVWLTNPTYNSIRPGDSISLFLPDVVKVNKIIAGNATSFPDSTNYTDITDSFLIDYGQKDDRYDHSRLVLKSGYDSPAKKLLVHVDFYQHIYATGSNVSFFSVDSYSQQKYDDELIPLYLSSDGTVYNLRDCLDFRPTLPIGASSSAYTVPNIPSPDDITELSHDFYLPRIDKLVLSKDKEFRVITGRSAVNPYPPDDVDEAMTLYQLNIPPYAADPQKIKLRYIDNRRMTMKELSSLEKRVQKLEYFTSLNNVENLALADKTAYEDGTEKEKYGIVGENFKNFNIADYRSPDFACALEGGMLIPKMFLNNFGLKKVASSATVKENKKTISLNYTETPAISQGVASNKAISVQPFLFGTFNGTMELSPETDYWVSDVLKPEIISVPERIIEHHTVIRELIIEPAPPVTIINIYPSSNADTTIITNPGTTPPVDPPAVVIIDPVVTPPIIPPEPVEPPLPPPVYTPDPIIIPPMPDFDIDLSFPFPPIGMISVGSFSGIGLPGTGGTYFPPTTLPAEPSNPIVSEPIILGGGGGGGALFGSPEFVMDDSGLGRGELELFLYDYKLV